VSFGPLIGFIKTYRLVTLWSKEKGNNGHSNQRPRQHNAGYQILNPFVSSLRSRRWRKCISSAALTLGETMALEELVSKWGMEKRVSGAL
jgi:hypothetical protein